MAEYDNSVASDGSVVTPPSGVITERTGEPSLPSMARGVVKDTMQQLAANNREHNCDICSGLNKDIATAKAEVMTFVGELRTSIEGLFAGTSTNPAVEDIKQQIAAVKAKVKSIQKQLQPIQDQIKAVQQYIADMQALIKEIQSLPAQLQTLLQGCLADATKGLTDAVNEAKSVVTDTTKQVTGIVSDAQQQVGTITQTVSQATPQTITDVVVTTTSPTN